jgi:pectinesterase inhibitor-like protein
MAFLKFSPFSLLFLAIFALFLSHNAEAKHKNQRGINPICKSVPNMRLCSVIVNGATNAHDAAINAIHAAIKTSKRIQTMTPLIAKAATNLGPAARDALVKSCSEDFEDTVGELETGIRYISRGDMSGADSYLSGAVSTTSDCRDAVTEQGSTVLALDKIIDHFNEVMDATLTLVHQIQV